MRDISDIRLIHCVPYVHADYAWTNTRQWHVKRYAAGMARVLDYMKQNPEFTFMIDNVSHYYAAVERYLPGRLDEVRDHVRTGRISIVNGGMSLARPYGYGDELYLRNMVAGRRELLRRFPEADIRLFFNADTGVGHSQLPQLISRTGHRYYRFMRPYAALSHAGIPGEFVWRGLDGSAITVTRGGYCGFAYTACFEPGLTWEERKERFVRDDIGGALALATTDELFMTIGGDDTYPQKSMFDHDIDIDGFMREWNEREGARMVYSTPNAYYAALESQPLHEVCGVLDPVDLFYNTPFGSGLSLYRLRRQAETLLLTCERLEVLLRALGGSGDAGALAPLWDRLFTFAGHAMSFLIEEDMDEILERAHGILSAARQYRRELTARIARLAGSEGPDAYIVINPDPAARTATVQLHVTTPDNVNGLKLLDEAGRELGYQIVDCYDGDKPYANKDFNEVRVALTLELPPLGYRRVRAVCDGASIAAQARAQDFSLSEAMPANAPIAIDNGRFRFVLSGGMVRSVTDSATGAELIADTGVFGQLRFYATGLRSYLLPEWDRDDLRSFRADSVRCTQRGPERWQVEYCGMLNGLKAAVTIVITRDSPTLGYTVRFDCAGEEGYFAMAFPCAAQPDVRAGIPFGSEARDFDGTFYSADHGMTPGNWEYYERGCKGGFSANRFASFACGGARLLLTQGDCSHLYRRNDEGEVETMFMRSMDAAQRRKLWMRHQHPSAFGVGSHEFAFTVSVLDAAASPAAQEAIVSAQRFPALCEANCDVYPLPPAAQVSAMAALPEGVTATACYAEGETTVLRLYENGGAAQELTLSASAVEICDLLGNAQERLDAVDGLVTLTVQPWEIAMLRLIP